MDGTASTIDYYAVLGVDRDANEETIRHGYQKLLLKLHPDKQNDMDDGKDVLELQNEFLDVQKAWSVLKDDRQRAAYDASMFARSYVQKHPVHDSIEIIDMEWDDEDCVFQYACRCGGWYVVSSEELAEGYNIVCCDDCSLSIEILPTTTH